MVIVLYALTAFLYAGLTWHAWVTRNPQGRLAAAGPALAEAAPAGGPAAWWRGAWLLVLLTHGLLLHETIFRDNGMVFGFAYALSAMLWLGIGIYWIESFFFALAGLGLIVTPVALIASLLPLLFPGSQILGYAASGLFKFHFIIANVAYGLFTLAAFHAVLMLLAERRLHTFSRPGAGMAVPMREPLWLGRWLDLLPPLMTLEKLLFRLIGAGFVLLTLTIVSGVLFSETIFNRAARFDHKTVFALVSWVMFGGILLARRLYGWRGRVALRWVIAAFCMLLLAYVGSRFVLEVVVHRL